MVPVTASSSSSSHKRGSQLGYFTPHFPCLALITLVTFGWIKCSSPKKTLMPSSMMLKLMCQMLRGGGCIFGLEKFNWKIYKLLHWEEKSKYQSSLCCSANCEWKGLHRQVTRQIKYTHIWFRSEDIVFESVFHTLYILFVCMCNEKKRVTAE